MRFQNPNGHSTCLHNRITSSRELISLGILAFGSSQIDAPMLIEGNHVYDCGVDNGGVGAEGDGIQVSNCRGVRIIGNHVENTLWAGIRTGSGAFGAVISGNTCLKNRPGIYVELSINSTRAIDAAGERRGATVIGNTVDGDGQEDSSGIQISWAAGCVVEGNLVANTWSEGIYTDSDYTTIVGNKVQNSWMGGTPGGGLAQKAGIRCDQASDCVIVSNTCFDNQASPTQEYGIAVMDDNNIVAHNKIRGNAVGGLYQDSDGSSNFVFNNDDGRSVPPTIALSGNDLHVPAGEELVIVPGTTQINLIVAQRPGAKVTLLFEDVLVVNDGQYNIRLEGSVNMTTSANDTLSLVCDGTNWYETARTVI